MTWNESNKGVTSLKLHYYKCNPTENMTILVTDPVPPLKRAVIANRLMAETHLCAEQVGYVTFRNGQEEGQEAHATLEMMGGEFCANATRSLAAVLAFNGSPGISQADDQQYLLKVSGVKKLVQCSVSPLEGEALYLASVDLPLPLTVQHLQVEHDNREVEATLVAFPGITHLVVDDTELSDKKAFFRDTMNQLAGRKDEALGIMFYNTQTHFVTPLVWVRDTDTLFWERGCGSGTAAVGVYLAHKNRQSVTVDIRQPGGVLSIQVEWDQAITCLYLAGKISIVSKGIAYV